MSLGERHPGGNLKQAWPLAVSLAAHGLLVLAWLHFGQREQLRDDTPQPLSVLLLLTPASAPAPPTPPQPATAARPHPSYAPAPPGAVFQRAQPLQDRASPSPPAAPAAAAAGSPAPARSAWDMLDAAKRDIRAGSAMAGAAHGSALRQADSKWTRFEHGVADAKIDDSPGPVTEVYTAPDGQVLYRTRVNGKAVCRKSGSTGPPAPWRSDEAVRAGAGGAATLGVANSAGVTLCPESDPGWQRR